MYRVLRNSRIPLFLPRKSNHVFMMWQHLVLLTIRRYEGKSYRMFIEWLIEAYSLDILRMHSSFYIIAKVYLHTEVRISTE
jgi:hypothetical protein